MSSVSSTLRTHCALWLCFVPINGSILLDIKDEVCGDYLCQKNIHIKILIIQCFVNGYQVKLNQICLIIITSTFLNVSNNNQILTSIVFM